MDSLDDRGNQWAQTRVVGLLVESGSIVSHQEKIRAIG